MVCCYYNWCELTVALFGSVSLATVLICQHRFFIFFPPSLFKYFFHFYCVCIFYFFFLRLQPKCLLMVGFFIRLCFMQYLCPSFWYCYRKVFLCNLLQYLLFNIKCFYPWYSLSALVLFIAIFKTSQTLSAKSWQDSTVSSHKSSTNMNLSFLRKCE